MASLLVSVWNTFWLWSFLINFIEICISVKSRVGVLVFTCKNYFIKWNLASLLASLKEGYLVTKVIAFRRGIFDKLVLLFVIKIVSFQFYSVTIWDLSWMRINSPVRFLERMLFWFYSTSLIGRIFIKILIIFMLFV